LEGRAVLVGAALSLTAVQDHTLRHTSRGEARGDMWGTSHCAKHTLDGRPDRSGSSCRRARRICCTRCTNYWPVGRRSSP
jgi:hypothetical protein